MNLSIEEVFKYSYCITIDAQRYENFNKVFKYFNLPIPKKFEGVNNKKRKGAEGCYLSHKKLIEYAKENNFPYVLVFEDDAYPCKNVIERLTDAFTNIPDNCGILGLGYNQIRSKFKIINKYITFYSLPAGTHAFLVFSKAYDELLASLDKERIADWALKNENFSENCKPYWIHNFIFIQRYCSKGKTISDIKQPYVYPINLHRQICNPNLQHIYYSHSILPNLNNWIEIDDNVKTISRNNSINIIKNNIFKHSYCITINEKRYQYLCKTFSHYGLPVPTKFEGVKHEHGPTGCYLSHRKLIEYAKENKLPYITIFEDDAYPCKDIIYELARIIKRLPKAECGIYSFGYNGIRGKTKKVFFNGETFYSFNRPAGAHAYIVFAKAYNELLASLDKEKIADRALRFSNFSNRCKPLWGHTYLFIQNNIDTNQMSRMKSHYIYPMCRNNNVILFSNRLPSNKRFEKI